MMIIQKMVENGGSTENAENDKNGGSALRPAPT